MPRAYWKQKNPYCRKSKLSKSIFERLVYFYFAEVIQRRSRDFCSQQLQIGTVGMKLSRQSLSKYFNKLGDFIWENMILPTDPIYEETDMMDNLHGFLYGKIKTIPSNYNVAYKFVRNEEYELDKDSFPIQRSLMYYLLSERSKDIRGIKKNNMYLEFSRIFFICSVMDVADISFYHHEDFFKDDIGWSLNKRVWNTMIALLEEHPLS